jgi:hypothetical protein
MKARSPSVLAASASSTDARSSMLGGDHSISLISMNVRIVSYAECLLPFGSGWFADEARAQDPCLLDRVGIELVVAEAGERGVKC